MANAVRPPRGRNPDAIRVPVNALCIVEYSYVDESSTVREAVLHDGTYRAVRRKLAQLRKHTLDHSRVIVLDVDYAAGEHARYFAEALFEVNADDWLARGATGYGQV